jgi:hypothetical protein
MTRRRCGSAKIIVAGRTLGGLALWLRWMPSEGLQKKSNKSTNGMTLWSLQVILTMNQGPDVIRFCSMTLPNLKHFQLHKLNIAFRRFLTSAETNMAVLNVF